MDDLQLILAGYALGAIPTQMAARILVAWLGKRAGVKPKEIEEFSDAAGGETDQNDA